MVVLSRLVIVVMVLLATALAAYILSGEKLMTQEEAINYFVKNRGEFERLRDELIADSHQSVVIYSSGSYHSMDKAKDKQAPVHLAEYVNLIKKLGLINASKIQTLDGKPLIQFCVSATGFLGDGQSREIWYTTGKLDHRYGSVARFGSEGWYVQFDDTSLKRAPK